VGGASFDRNDTTNGQPVKVATWNVNGIRAREAQLCDWLARDRPDVVCLQEIKARPDQVPERCKLADYHAFWHGSGGYSGVSLHVRRELLETPEFRHPEFDMETRIVHVALGNLVLASVYVPNGGKDFTAKLAFLTALAAWSKTLHDEGRELVLCGDINVARAEVDVHPKERKPGIIGQRPEERELFQGLLGDHLVDVTRALDPDNEGLFTWWPPWRTSAGASTTSSRRARSRSGRRAARCWPTSGRAITPRS